MTGVASVEKGPAVRTIGDPLILSRPLLAVVCSTTFPPDLVLPSLDCLMTLRRKDAALIGGFHSPLERIALELALDGDQQVVLCPARSLDRFRPSSRERKAIEAGRLLLVSPFRNRRTEAAAAERRNRMVIALSASLLVLHARPGSRSEATARHAAAVGLPIQHVAHSANADLELLGSRPWGASDAAPAEAPAGSAGTRVGSSS